MHVIVLITVDLHHTEDLSLQNCRLLYIVLLTYIQCRIGILLHQLVLQSAMFVCWFFFLVTLHMYNDVCKLTEHWLGQVTIVWGIIVFIFLLFR